METLTNRDIVSIIRGVNPKFIESIAEVLIDEGIKWIEVSISDEKIGLECIDKLSKKFSKNEIKLGAGTVTNNEQVDRVLSVGASYIITPGWDKELIRYINSKNVLVIPGVFSPSDVMQAQSEGIKLCKLFPANDLKSSYIKSLKGPFPKMDFLAVGGVKRRNIEEYLDYGFKTVAIGSDLVPRNAKKKDLENIRKSAQTYMKIMSKRNDSIETN
ncbi:MAG: bifunctional 4-hydroxy-2-oxoglutarate aldolase/2-dehydro-3-deoxy-phosphogluconate aldolase [Firmicutes bacterium]|nr:bifunctional 4-hydroxy-2-oxoglutarate aldolase/2-dehydro-3-deoxy-phosphogluconate aldolase [Bacillota bacterium]